MKMTTTTMMKKIVARFVKNCVKNYFAVLFKWLSDFQNLSFFRLTLNYDKLHGP